MEGGRVADERVVIVDVEERVLGEVHVTRTTVVGVDDVRFKKKAPYVNLELDLAEGSRLTQTEGASR